jgi:hypothetical protein
MKLRAKPEAPLQEVTDPPEGPPKASTVKVSTIGSSMTFVVFPGAAATHVRWVYDGGTLNSVVLTSGTALATPEDHPKGGMVSKISGTGTCGFTVNVTDLFGTTVTGTGILTV